MLLRIRLDLNVSRSSTGFSTGLTTSVSDGGPKSTSKKINLKKDTKTKSDLKQKETRRGTSFHL